MSTFEAKQINVYSLYLNQDITAKTTFLKSSDKRELMRKAFAGLSDFKYLK